MTQYHYDRPPTTAVETSSQSTRVTDRDLRSLAARVDAQERELQELRHTVRRLQNELRSAVNAFNLRNG